MKRLLAIGECMVEMAPTGAAGTYYMGFAGDTMNTAWYLAKLLQDQASIEYFTAIGTDSVSDQMLAFLKDAGIGADKILRRTDRTVGLYTIQLNDGERSFTYWRGQSAARTLAENPDDLRVALRDVDILYFSGITLAILSDADRATLLEAVQQFRSSGGDVVFDPNLRPKLWKDSDTMKTAIMQAAELSDIVLPSYEDEASWFGDATPADTAKRYSDAGASTVIVKNGAGEILVWTDSTTSQHEPEQVTTVVDTTAAGDSFNAGFLAAWIDGKAMDQAVSAAAKLAARVVTHRGALVAEAVALP